MPLHRGKGYATELLSALMRRAFEDGRVKEIVARTTSGNKSALAVINKAGFLKTGTEGEVLTHRITKKKASTIFNKRLLLSLLTGGALLLNGCVAVDGKIRRYNTINSPLHQYNGVFINKPVYSSNILWGFSGPNDLNDIFGGYKDADFLILEFNEKQGLSARLVKDNKVLLAKTYKPPHELRVLNNGRLMLKTQRAFGSDAAVLGYASKSISLFLDSDNNLGIIESGGGFGIFAIFPLAIYGKVMAIFPRSAQQITIDEKPQEKTSAAASH